MPALSTSENQFGWPVCRSIGTEGPQPSTRPPDHVPASVQNAFRNLLLKCGYLQIDFFLSPPDQQLCV